MLQLSSLKQRTRHLMRKQLSWLIGEGASRVRTLSFQGNCSVKEPAPHSRSHRNPARNVGRYQSDRYFSICTRYATECPNVQPDLNVCCQSLLPFCAFVNPTKVVRVRKFAPVIIRRPLERNSTENGPAYLLAKADKQQLEAKVVDPVRSAKVETSVHKDD